MLSLALLFAIATMNYGFFTIRGKAAAFLLLSFIAAVIIPLIAFIWAVSEKNGSSVVYHWNVVCFINSIFLAYILYSSTFKTFFKLIGDKPKTEEEKKEF